MKLVIVAILVANLSYGQAKSDSTKSVPDSVSSISVDDVNVIINYLKTNKEYTYSDVILVDKAFGYLINYSRNKKKKK